MFYPTSELPKGILKACFVPRPIAWISSVSSSGVPNLAPFSFFSLVADSPATLVFSTTGMHISGGPKDTLQNIETQKEFVVNVATYALREALSLSSANLARDQNEFEYSNLAWEDSKLVNVPSVKDSPINIECIYHQSIQLPSDDEKMINRMVIARVVGINIDPRILSNGRIDVEKLQPIARLGYNDYTVINSGVFSMTRPKLDSEVDIT